MNTAAQKVSEYWKGKYAAEPTKISEVGANYISQLEDCMVIPFEGGLSSFQTHTMSTDETARILGISKSRLYDGIKQGAFPFAAEISGQKHSQYVIMESRFKAWLDGKFLG